VQAERQAGRRSWRRFRLVFRLPRGPAIQLARLTGGMSLWRCHKLIVSVPLEL
jgi:hypothetical protein